MLREPHHCVALGRSSLGVLALALAGALAIAVPIGEARAQGGGISEAALSPPFDLYLAPGFIRPDAGAIAAGNSGAFGLYLAAGFRPLAAGAVASGASPAFALYLGVLREGFAVSPPFALDTHLANAFVGQIRDATTSQPVAGVVVELYLGSTRISSTTTDGSGSYLFYATVPGSYVVRATKAGYVDGTTDLLRFSGATISASLNLAPLSAVAQHRPDLVIGTNDLTYTVVTSGMLTLTAMVHNAGDTQAGNVHVRFYDASTSSGINSSTAITPDAVIASLAAGEAKPVSVSWTTPNGHQRFYAFADPDHQITESTTINNGNFKDLGVYGRTAPRVTAVTARYDGLSDPHAFGQFLTGIHGAIDYFSATVATADNDVAKVQFDFDGHVVEDTNGDDGWSVPFDTGDLATGTRPLRVTAYNTAGVASETWEGVLVVRGWPAWMVGHLAPGNLPVSFDIEAGYLNFSLDVYNAESPGKSLISFVDALNRDILVLGSKRTDIELTGSIHLAVPLMPSLPWKAGGSIERNETVFDQTLNSTSFDFEVTISPDGNTVQSVTFGPLAAQAQLFHSPEIATPPLDISGIDVALGVSVDAFLNASLTGTFAGDFSSYEIDLNPQVGADINASLELSTLLGFTKLEVVLSPRVALGLQLAYAHPPGHMSVGGTFDEEINGRITGSLLWGVISQTFYSWKWGPWHQDYPRQPALSTLASAALPSDSVNVPRVFPFPAAAAAADGQLGVVWVSDIGTEPGRPNPEIYAAVRDTSGAWGAAERITSNDRFESTPALTWMDDGRALAVWVQNSLLESEAASVTSLSAILDRQDLWCSVRSAAGWSAPLPTMADSTPPYRADGLPVLARCGQGAMLVWTRSVGDSALAPGASEIYAARYDGAAWSPPARLTNDLANDAGPAVCSSGRDSVTTAWVREDPAGSGVRSIAWAAWNGSVWGPRHALRSSPGGKQSISLAPAPDGRLLASWVESSVQADSTLRYHLFAATKQPADTTWGAPTEVFADAHFVESPIARVDRRGIAALVWRGYTQATGDLMVSLNDLTLAGAPWSAPRAITSDTLTDWMATAAIDGQNNLHVIDLKTDLAVSGGAAPAGNFLRGLSIASRGITRDLGVNEQLNFGFRPLSSDLRLLAGSVAISKAAPAVGDTITVTARVDNIGDVRSAITAVGFYDGPPDSGGVPLPGGRAALAPVAPDSSLAVGVQWIVTAGPHRLCAVADPDNLVPEQTKSNNRAYASIGIFPDLVVDSLGVANDDPVPGAADSVTAFVRNAGGSSADGIAVRLLRGAGVLRTVAGLTLHPGQSVAITLPFAAVVGVDTLAVVADPDSAIGDANRSNNRAAVVLRVLPDLALSPDSVSYSAPDTTLSASVANLGGVRSGAFAVVFYGGNPLIGGVPIDSVRVDSLAAFASRRVSVPWRAGLGMTTVYVVADPTGTLTERARGNNETYGDVVQGALPDLIAIQGSIDVQIVSGPSFTLSAKVANTGAAHALAVGVEFFRGNPDSGGVLIADRLLTTLAMRETVVVSVPWTSPDSVTNPVYVVVDRAGAIEELRRDNNRASRVFGAVVDVPLRPVLPAQLALHPARPNPFTGQTALHFDLPAGGRVSLDIYDVAGRHVRSLASGTWPPGFHVVQWNGASSDGRPLAAGVYFTRLVAPGGTLQRRVVMLR